MAILQGFAKHRGRGGEREVGLRQGEVETLMSAAPSTSSIYRGEGGGAPPLGFPPQGVRQPQSHLRVAAKGGEGGNLPPKLGGSPPPPNPRRLGPLWGGAPAHLGLVPSHTWPMQPPGAGGPTWWTPGTLPVVPVHYRSITPETFPVTKIGLPIYKYLPPDHSGTPRDVRDLIRDSEQHSVTTYKLPL